MNKLINLFFGFCIFLIAVPFNYFFENNFNALPFQFLLSIFISISFFKLKPNNLLFIVFSFLALVVISNGDISNFALSAVAASFFTFWLIIVSPNLKLPQYKYNNIVNIILFFILVMIVYYSIDFYLKNNFELRSKGFGSGTIFSVIALYGFCTIYLTYVLKKLNLIIFIPLSLLFLTPILITQSRGVLLTVIFICVAIELKRIKKINFRGILLIFRSVLFISIIFGYIIFNTNIINRLNVSYFNDLNHLTSGRLDVQLYIWDLFVTESNWIKILFGNGYNSLDVLVSKGYEFPHFDLLYLLHEGGIFLILLYVLTLFKLYKVFNIKLFFWIYIVSSLHTNMIILPGVFFLSKILDNQFNSNKF